MIAARLAISTAGIALFALSLAPLAAFAYTGEFTVYANNVGNYVNLTLVYSGIVPLKDVSVTVISNGTPIASKHVDALYDGGNVTLLIPASGLSDNVKLQFNASIAGIYDVNYEVEYSETPGS